MPIINNNTKLKRPFGEPVMKHRTAATLLGVGSKALTQMKLQRVFFQGAYVYDPAEIHSIISQRGKTNHNES